jgi:hypothetical protein
MEALFCLFVFLALVGGGAIVGWLSADRFAGERRQRLDQQEAEVQAEMDALMRAQRLNAAFLAARRAMWEEAQRHRTRGYG